MSNLTDPPNDRGVITAKTGEADREAVAAFFNQRGRLYVVTSDFKNYCWHIALKPLRAIFNTPSLTLGVNPSPFYCVGRDHDSHVVVHQIHSNGVRTGREIPDAHRVALLTAFGLPTGETDFSFETDEEDEGDCPNCGNTAYQDGYCGACDYRDDAIENEEAHHA